MVAAQQSGRRREAGADDPRGQVLGSYQVTERIGVGGMGTVYRAHHVLLGKPAAIKLLRPEYSSDETIISRLFNEARAASAAHHPGIVEVFDFGYAEDGRAYLVMELLDGEPLSSRLADRGNLPEAEAEGYIRGLASALAAAHDAGVIHRDLKPDNVFLVRDADMPTGERVKLLDFGIAKVADRRGHGANLTRTGIVMGTPTYMSPEQARGAGDLDLRSDLYSLGCVFYEMLCGRPPFIAEGCGEVIAAHLMMRPTPVRRLNRAVSPKLEAIVMRLLAKAPDDRYASARALLAALDGDNAVARMPTQLRAPRGLLSELDSAPTLHQTTLGSAAIAVSSRPMRPRRAPRLVAAMLAVGTFIGLETIPPGSATSDERPARSATTPRRSVIEITPLRDPAAAARPARSAPVAPAVPTAISAPLPIADAVTEAEADDAAAAPLSPGIRPQVRRGLRRSVPRPVEAAPAPAIDLLETAL